MKTKNWILELIVFMLSALFTYTAVSKLNDLRKFTGQINNQPFDNIFTPYLVYGLPAVEILVTLLMIYPKTRLYGLYGSASLMTVFSIYVALVTFHYYDRVPCGCATAFEHLSWPQHLAINIIFTLLALTGIYFLRVKHTSQ